MECTTIDIMLGKWFWLFFYLFIYFINLCCHLLIIFLVLCHKFNHDDKSLYVLSKRFAAKICENFCLTFGPIMKRFDNNLEIEGLKEIEGHFARKSFNCFSIIRDYNCWIYDNPIDYRYNIILWLHSTKCIYI